MATQVEVSAPLAALVNLGEQRSGATLPHAFLTSLSEAGNHRRETLQDAPLARAVGMLPVVSRPRLTPKPFSRGQSSDSFAMVRPPIPSLKSGPGAPKATALGQTSAGTTDVMGLAGKVPPLVDHQAAQSRSCQEVVGNVPFCSGSPANMVILFESGRLEPGSVKGTPEEVSNQAAKAEATYRKPECVGSIHKQLSLSSEAQPASWNLCRPVERKETFSGNLKEQGKDVAKQQGREEHQPRPRTRPVLAFFLESLKEPKLAGPEVSGETLEPEKPWTRKPRPLSMDLTARFESRELSLQRKPSLLEGPERKPVAHVTSEADGRTLQAGEAASMQTPDLSSKSDSQGAAGAAAHSLGIKSQAIQKPSSSETSPAGQSLLKKNSPLSTKERKSLWEQRLKNQLEEPKERERVTAEPSEKSKEPPSFKGPPPAPDQAASGQLDSGAPSKRAAEALGPGSRGWRSGSVQRTARCPEAGGKTPASPASYLESSEKGNQVLKIHQRIQELTAENAETKPGLLRQSFRSRPLSADLTKLFSSPAATGGEAQPARQYESNRKPASEAEDVHEEGLPPRETSSREGYLDAAPQKPQQVSKMPLKGGHPKRDVSPVKDQWSGTLQPDEEPTLALSHEVKIPSTPPAGSMAIRTVRATLFDNTVQRLSVAATHLGPDPPRAPGSELVEGQLGPSWESQVERVLDTGEMVPSRQADGPTVSEKHKKAKPTGAGKTMQVSPWDKWNVLCHSDHSVAKHVEESLMYQRIEPRYEILQTVGERVQSEAVVAVPGDKAITLHSKMSLKEQRRAESGCATGATWPQNLDTNGDMGKDNSFISELNHVAEGATKTRASKELNVSHMQTVEQSKNWAGQQAQPLMKASPIQKRTEDAVLMEDRSSQLSSKTEKGRSKVLLTGLIEGPKRQWGPGVGPDGSNSSEGDIVVGSQGPFVTSEGGNQPSLCRAVQEQRWTGREASVTHRELGPRVSGPNACPAAFGPPEPHALSMKAGGALIQLSDSAGEERPWRNLHPTSLRALDRWRRRTLPHGAASFEELGWETVKPLAQTDSLQLREGTLARSSSRGAQLEGEPKGRNGVRSPLSPSERKATYFALTCQRPAAEKGNAPRSPLEPLQSKQASSLSGEPTPPLGTLGRSQLNDSAPGADKQDVMQRSLDGPLHRGEEGSPEPPGRGDMAHPPAQVRAGGWVGLEGAEEPRPLSHLRSLLPGSSQGQPMYQSHCGRKGQAVESYRSRVLDLDLLMVEYQEGSKKAALIPKKGDASHSQESSWWPWEQRVPPRSPTEREILRGPPGWEHSLNIICQGGSQVEPFPLQEGERLQGGWSQGSSPTKARETKFIPPPWGRRAAEMPKSLPSDHVGARKKTFLLEEEPAEALRPWQPSMWSANHGPADVTVEPPPTPPSSLVLARKSLLKWSSPEPNTGVHLEEKWHRSLHTKRAGASLQQDPSGAQSGAQTLPIAVADWRHSYSEKVHQARASASLPSGTPSREGQAEEGGAVVQTSLLEGTPSHLMSRRSAVPWNPPISGRTKDQLKQCFGRPSMGVKDTDTLVPEADSYYGTLSDQRLSEDSLCSCFVPESPSLEGNLTPTRWCFPSSQPSSYQKDPTPTTQPHNSLWDPQSTSLDRLSTDVELSCKGPDPPALATETSLDFSFLEQTQVLDSSALKTRVQLSKRRRQHRASLPHLLRRRALHKDDGQPCSVEEEEAESAWMFRDSTGERLDEEGKPPPSEKSPFAHLLRLPVLPRMDHLAFKAQFRNRKELEGTGGATPAQPSWAPKSTFQAGLTSGRMLPLDTKKEERVEEPPSPQWLKELRSKKRQIQYDPGMTPTA